MEQLLEWIKKEGFVLHKDGRWYSPKRYKGNSSIYYKHEQLIQLYEREIIC